MHTHTYKHTCIQTHACTHAHTHRFDVPFDLAFLCFDLWWPSFSEDFEEGQPRHTHTPPPAAFSLLLEVHWLKSNNYSKYCQHDLLSHKVGEKEYFSFSINIYVSRCTCSQGARANRITKRSRRSQGLQVSRPPPVAHRPPEPVFVFEFSHGKQRAWNQHCTIELIS